MPGPRQLLPGHLIGGGALLLLALGGCAHYYWTRPGSPPERFALDSGECARDAVSASADPGQGVLSEERYRACLNARGYTRGKKLDPPPAGWYRGLE